MTTAIAYSTDGGPGVLHAIKIESPTAGPGQVRVLTVD
jgi:NADPH:quinone reductase-like Zn-dependent oxidoreductase